MEPSSEDKEAEIDAAFKRSQIQAMCSEVNSAVSREIACGSNGVSATQLRLMTQKNEVHAYVKYITRPKTTDETYFLGGGRSF